MSKISIEGNASGTGTLTIAAPNTNTNYTLGLPEEAGTITTSNSPYSTFRNRIINGDMRIDQRNAGAAVTVNTVSNQFSVDRWKVEGQATDGVYTAQQDTSVPTGFNNSLKITVTTADASIGSTQRYQVIQSLEGYNVADLGFGAAGAKTTTLSFWVRSSLTGTFGGSYRNFGASRSYPFSYTISVADTWEYKTVTIEGDTSGTWLKDSGVGIILTFSMGSGTNFQGTAGAWNSNNNNTVTGETQLISTLNATWYITGVQLEVGSVATPFERRPYGTELSLCQRYFLVGPTGASGQWILTTAADLAYGFPVEMRASPTVSHLNNYTVVSYGVASRTVTATSLSGTANTRGCIISVTSTGATAGTPAGANSNGVGFSAEL